ncbi:hypothetical protein [Bradyrhizobium sp. JYMT SZCCT0428]|uniref:hypothetical protein n=1 Tax=Bradyrhizobium sp. JYMT SZCCT0428 TaxID=2807673 RepID=UPI001BABC890|nr:hypothetical protein [Bradyrhizobium sp. JYMT SZCCT0428]MBR1156945.1 hypothetical protein [Bradyrhizobium sp. JYMT SZCCT0428]
MVDEIRNLLRSVKSKVEHERKGIVALETKTRGMLYAYEMLSSDLDHQGTADLTRRVIESLQGRLVALQRERDLADAGLNPSQLEKYKDRSDKSESAVSFLERVYQPSKRKIEQGLIRKYDKALYEALHNWVQYLNRRQASDSDPISVKDLISGNPIPDEFKTIIGVEGRKGIRDRRAQTARGTSNRRRQRNLEPS